MSLEALKAMRLAGRKPALVCIHICGAKQPKWWHYSDGIPEVVLAEKPESARADFRPVVGCDVMLMADHKSFVLTAVTKAVQAHAWRVTVVIADRLPETIGHEWTKGQGWREVAHG